MSGTGLSSYFHLAHYAHESGRSCATFHAAMVRCGGPKDGLLPRQPPGTFGGPKREGHRLHPRDPWRSLILNHYRRAIEEELANGQSSGHIDVLGQLKQRYKALDWTRPHDIPKVFPPLPWR